jgi:hypothetical protein
MRINLLKALDLILSLSKDEAKLPGFFSSLSDPHRWMALVAAVSRRLASRASRTAHPCAIISLLVLSRHQVPGMSGLAHGKPLLGIDSGNNFTSSRASKSARSAGSFPKPIAWIYFPIEPLASHR